MSRQAKIYGAFFTVLITVIAGSFYIDVGNRGPAGPVASEKTNVHVNAPNEVEATAPSAVATPSPDDAK
jgi:hypothetical protein